jgi:hypothetical protein
MALVALSRSLSAARSSAGFVGPAGDAAFGADEDGGVGFAGAAGLAGAAFGADGDGAAGFAGVPFGAAGDGDAGFAGAGGCSTGVGCGASGGFRAHPAVNNSNEKAAQTKRIS